MIAGRCGRQFGFQTSKKQNMKTKSITVPAVESFAEKDKFAKGNIDVINWAEYPYKPVVRFAVAHTDNALLVLNSGRYEFHNKGIDVFIDALGRLNVMPSLNREVVAVIDAFKHKADLCHI